MSEGFDYNCGVRRGVFLLLGSSCILQLGGCIGSLIPAALAFGEQTLFSSIISDLLSL